MMLVDFRSLEKLPLSYDIPREPRPLRSDELLRMLCFFVRSSVMEICRFIKMYSVHRRVNMINLNEKIIDGRRQ